MSSGTNRYYESQNHVFYNENGDTVTIKPKGGQTLNLQNVNIANNNQVIYNNNGILKGSNGLTYDEITLSTNSIESQLLNGPNSTIEKGYNEIYRGIDPQTVITSNVNAGILGYDLVMSKNANILASACQNTSALDGSIFLSREVTGTFTEYSGFFQAGAFGSGSNDTDFCALNEDGDLAILFNGNTTGGQFMTTYTRSGTTWTAVGTGNSNCHSGRLSGNRALLYDYKSNFYTRTWDGSVWTFEASILVTSDGINRDLSHPLAINGNTLVFSYSGKTYVYTLSGTWTLTNTLNLNAISIDLSNNVLSILTSNSLVIYESGILVQTISITGTEVCNNGTYIFVNSSGFISIYKKVGSWTKSVNTTYVANGSKMSCNNDYLGICTIPSIKIFKIETFMSASVVPNLINMSDISNKISIDSTELILKTGDLRILDTSNTTSITNGSIQTLGGMGITKSLFVGEVVNATTFSSTNGAFKSAMWKSSTSQSLSGTIVARVRFPDAAIENTIVGLSRGSSGDNLGTFTFANATRALICYSIRTSSASSGDVGVWIEVSGVSERYCQQGSANLTYLSASGSVILNFTAGQSFSLWVYSGVNTSISNGATFNLSAIQIYSLN